MILILRLWELFLKIWKISMLFYLVRERLMWDIKYRPSHGNGAGRDQTFLLYDARQNILHQQKYFDNSWQHVSCTVGMTSERYYHHIWIENHFGCRAGPFCHPNENELSITWIVFDQKMLKISPLKLQSAGIYYWDQSQTLF